MKNRGAQLRPNISAVGIWVCTCSMNEGAILLALCPQSPSLSHLKVDSTIPKTFETYNAAKRREWMKQAAQLPISEQNAGGQSGQDLL